MGLKPFYLVHWKIKKVNLMQLLFADVTAIIVDTSTDTIGNLRSPKIKCKNVIKIKTMVKVNKKDHYFGQPNNITILDIKYLLIVTEKMYKRV